LRYSYGRIIADAFNTLNEDLLRNAISSFCTPDCYVKEFFSGTGPNPYGPRYRELGGAHSIANYWCIVASGIPDSLFDFQDIQSKFFPTTPDNFAGYIEGLNGEDKTDISSEGSSHEICRHYPGEGLVFVVRYTFSGTKLFDIVTEQTKRLELIGEGPEAPVYNAPNIYLQPLMNEKDGGAKIHPDIKLQGHWVIALNRENKIKRFEFHFRNAFE
jgi:hypothetical protein